MAVDFDFDGTFNEDDDEEGQSEEFEASDDDDGGEDEEGEEATRPNILRLILLALFILILLCAACAFLINSGLLPFDIPGLGDQPDPLPGQDTPTAQATDDGVLVTVVATDGAGATETATAVVEATSTEASQATTEATTEATATSDPSQEATATDEAGDATATTIPVPGPTATPGATATAGPTVAITIVSCDNNVPPVADAGGPYSAMRGKGSAVVDFDASSSSDSDGTIDSYDWDFGDGDTSQNGAFVTHGYSTIGSYQVTLTVTDNCGAIGQDTVDVTISGATPPAGDGTPDVATATPDPAATSTPEGSVSATLGTCYRARYGNTLTGIAWHFGVPLADLAEANTVSPNYLVIAGQGLFIPTGEIAEGPNVYEIETGDTLNNVAYRCGLTAAALAEANALTTEASLSPGQMLTIPLWK